MPIYTKQEILDAVREVRTDVKNALEGAGREFNEEGASWQERGSAAFRVAEYDQRLKLLQILGLVARQLPPDAAIELTEEQEDALYAG